MDKYEPMVYIIDDDITLLKAVSWLLESVDFKVITYTSAVEYLNSYNNQQCGCLLVDVRMPQMSGLELQEELAQRKNQLPIIIMSGHGDIAMAVRAMKAGAFDFIVKPFNDQMLLEIIQKAINKDRQRSPVLEKIAIYMDRYSSLTRREREIMQHVTLGKLNKQIASELNISLSTIELHRAHVMQKMQVKTIAELVRIALALEEHNIQGI